MLKIVLATTNQNKLREIEEALAGLDVRLFTLKDYPDAPEVEEDGETFEENALKKALAIARHTGKHALADDSGLAVDALGGAPGVRSARYAGEDATDQMNNRKLLAELSGLPEASRTARFVCVMALAAPDGESVVAEGSCEGVILEENRGYNGFGYDPVFFYPPLGKTFAEITSQEKLAVSHRGQAIRSLREKIKTRISG